MNAIVMIVVGCARHSGRVTRRHKVDAVAALRGGERASHRTQESESDAVGQNKQTQVLILRRDRYQVEQLESESSIEVRSFVSRRRRACGGTGTGSGSKTVRRPGAGK
jgi:hypothetical protein